MSEKEPDLSAEVKAHRLRVGLTQTSLAESCGVKQSYIAKLERGEKTFKVGSEFAAKLSQAFGVPLSHWAPFTSDGHLVAHHVELTAEPNGTETKGADARFEIPFHGSVAAGPVAMPLDTEPGAMVNLRERYPPGCFALRVSGHSLTAFGILDGDMLAVLPANRPRDGHMIVVRTEGGYTLLGCHDDRLFACWDSDGTPADREIPSGEIVSIVGSIVQRSGPVGFQPRKGTARKRK